MTVYVDELHVWPNAKHRCFKSGSSHLTADTIEELHAFAKRIGLRRTWFQNHRVLPHYDLTPARREAALNAGARLKRMRDQLRDLRSVDEEEEGR